MISTETVATIAALRTRIAAWRSEGLHIGLVPTMGALHEGHLSLVREARARADRVIVSVFVNPTQFAPHEDFDRYPRKLDDDRDMLAGTGVAPLIFAPCVEEMYPQGFATRIEIAGPALGLETDFRPHFFAGVATVVAKLLLAAMPDLALFGEKDYQQLLVVRRLARDLGLPVEVAGGAIVREADGLAMSSRNTYLKPAEREVAGKLNLVLKDVAARVRAGDNVAQAEAAGSAALLEAGFDTVDYLVVRDAETLAPLDAFIGQARILAAAKIGRTRLIDNMAV
jgi:pantoate--beta-alanine ligase